MTSANGKQMRSMIVLHSYHHHNTEKVARAIGGIIGAEIRAPSTIDPKSLSEYDLVGFGSGIYAGKHHQTLLDLADQLPLVTNKKAFIFSTSGRTGKIMVRYHRRLRDKLKAKGFMVVEEFNCGGFDTVGLKGIFGGIQKGRPSTEDLEQAEAFAQRLGRGAT